MTDLETVLDHLLVKLTRQ